MLTILRRLLGVVLTLLGVAALLFGGWFARSLGTEGQATFTTAPQAGLPVVIDAQTNARTDLPLVITATAKDDVPITLSIATPSDADALLDESRRVRVTGIEVRDGVLSADREWALLTETVGTGDPITPATADLWRSQETTDGSVQIEGDLETAPETMILTTPEDAQIDELTMTWTNPAWFYQALSIVFAGLLVALVGLALIIRRAPTADAEPAISKPAETEPADSKTTDSRTTESPTIDPRTTGPESTS